MEIIEPGFYLPSIRSFSNALPYLVLKETETTTKFKTRVHYTIKSVVHGLSSWLAVSSTLSHQHTNINTNTRASIYTFVTELGWSFVALCEFIWIFSHSVQTFQNTTLLLHEWGQLLCFISYYLILTSTKRRHKACLPAHSHISVNAKF